jgi:hypothetical protein
MSTITTLVQYRDIGTQTTNDEVTPGNIGELTGSRLMYDPAAADEGIYFIAAAAGSQPKVDFVQLNKPASQVFMVPALVAGVGEAVGTQDCIGWFEYPLDVVSLGLATEYCVPAAGPPQVIAGGSLARR